MSEFKGTKGEWKTDSEIVYSESEKEFIEGNVVCLAPEGLEKSMEAWRANAKLIACAPEMLEMLIDILETIRECETPRLYEIEQLIKKATE